VCNGDDAREPHAETPHRGPLVTSHVDRWFATEVLPLEAALTRYLNRVWPNRAEVPDLRQDVYMRVYGSATKSFPASPKAFVFQVARNLVIDRQRRERIVSIDYTQDFDSLNVLVDEISPEQRSSARQELRRLSTALDRLPEECRRVIWLRRVEGVSQREAAERLGMTESALESHLHRGIRALIKAVFGTEATHDAQEGAKRSENEGEHG
jgi:RNA polymerase sigma factor (sigma-70 family)